MSKNIHLHTSVPITYPQWVNKNENEVKVVVGGAPPLAAGAA